MLTWLIYDISDNKPRRQIAKACLDRGLYRVQKSVFLGDINSNQIDELIELSRDLIDTNTDNLYVMPMCREDFDKVQILGEGFDGELVADELITKVI